MPDETVFYGYDKDNKKLLRARLGAKGFLFHDTVAYNLIKFDPDDSQPNYIGLNVDVSAADTDNDWVIFKFTYSGSDVTKIEKKIGAWASRTTLF